MIERYTPKELTWLSFNERVLQEAENRSNPIIERMKFLGIYSNNQDEFFRVRVATLRRIAKTGEQSIETLGDDPRVILENVQTRVRINRKRVENVLKSLKADLRDNGINLVDESQILDEHVPFLKDFFYKKIRPYLMPIILDERTKIPDLKDDAVYFAVKIVTRGGELSHKNRYALMKVPSNRISRFVVFPEVKGQKYVMFIDDIIRFKLKTVFKIFESEAIEAYEVKVTKDSELDIDENIAFSYMDRVNESLKHRRRGRAVRFTYDEAMPVDMLDFLLTKFKFKRGDVVLPGGRYFNYKDFIKFPGLNLPEYEPIPVIPVKRMEECQSVFSEIAKRDVMLYYPYHTFDYFIDLLREASIDPKVVSIKITLYRVGKNSSVVNALINALRNGKIVVVVFELQARFDEEANIYWSRQLQEEGANVIFGVPGLKVHSKLCLITRKDHRTVEHVACISTGNFNEDTARMYTDIVIMTHNPRVTEDVLKLFQFMVRNYKREELHHLLASPFTFRSSFYDLINREINNAQAGKEAWVKIKLNNLCDPDVIDKLYEASSCGVKIKLLVRGMFCLWPGKPEFSQNIEAYALVDRFLEHSRMYIFCNAGDHDVYISSADLMTRNLDRRVEATCPVIDKTIARHLENIFEIQWSDNVKNRHLDAEMTNSFVTPPEGAKTVRSQYAVYEYLKGITDC